MLGWYLFYVNFVTSKSLRLILIRVGGASETLRHSTWKISAVSSCVIPWLNYSTLPAGSVLRTFMQYSNTFAADQKY